ncbi:MAG: hypothetical protein IKB73_06260 [Ruminococcus sp.]|nr:hypothetical protein [Ruminococcus sp.]
MKRILTFTLAVLMMATLFAGCKVETTVDSEYVDTFVHNYASPDEVDADGNVTYKFANKDIYDEFAKDYYEKVKEDSRLEIESSGQYSYYNPDITEIVVGVTPEAYEKLGEQKLKEEANDVGEAALKYQMNLKNPKGEITVIYRNANTAEDYFEIKVTA